MVFSRQLLGAFFLAASFGLTDVAAEKLGSVHAGTYGETTYEAITDLTLTSRRMFSNHTYEVLIPGTSTGRMILCQLRDSTGQVLSQMMDNSQSRETRFHFSLAVADAEAQCAYVEVERLTRPSGTP